MNPKQLKVSYIENNRIIRERILKTKLKKDGYLYLKNKNLQLILVPYIIGAIDIKKTRLTKSIDGNLVFDVTNHKSGAIFIIGFLNFKNYYYRLQFESTKKTKDEKETS